MFYKKEYLIEDIENAKLNLFWMFPARNGVLKPKRDQIKNCVKRIRNLVQELALCK